MTERVSACPRIDVEITSTATATTVVVHGELDLATTPVLQQRLDGILDAAAGGSRVQRLLVDLSGVPFCDVTGLNVLLRVRARLAARGGRLDLLGPCPSLQLMIDALGLTNQLELGQKPVPTGDTPVARLPQRDAAGRYRPTTGATSPVVAGCS